MTVARVMTMWNANTELSLVIETHNTHSVLTQYYIIYSTLILSSLLCQ